MNSLSVIIPAFNEEDNIESTVKDLVSTLNKRNLDWQIIIINDGSVDNTKEIMEKLASENSNINIIHNKQNSGIGYCFREGIDYINKETVTWIPADGENDISELIKYFFLFEYVDIIIPFVANICVRSLYRRLLSTVYLWFINLSFGTMFNYTNGNVVYKRMIFENIRPKSDGFFFQTECLIKAVRSRFVFAEVPVRIRMRKGGSSKALTFKSLGSVIKDFLSLFLDVHIFRTTGRVCKD